ncbi:MAG: hypothetical protein RIG62_19065 [Cyclobacteriaceae bacterium]
MTRYVLLPLGSILLLFAACHQFDSTKIIEPTDYQIQSVSFHLKEDIVPTNMVAQKMEEDQNFTLVGASLKQGNKEFVGLWLFNNENPTDIHSVNKNALDFSEFPQLQAFHIGDEADNLMAFLNR